jgi:hypothetical protein
MNGPIKITMNEQEFIGRITGITKEKIKMDILKMFILSGLGGNQQEESKEKIDELVEKINIDWLIEELKSF